VCIFPSTFHTARVTTREACHNTNVFPLSQVASASTGWGASLTCVWTPGRTLLALSVMQAAACDVRERWQRMGRDTRAAAFPLPNLPSLRQALTQVTPSRGGPSGRGSTTGGATDGAKGGRVTTDMAALKASGVVGATLLNPPPLVIHEKGATPPIVRGDAAF